MTENGQSLSMPATGSCIIEAKPKKTVARNNTSTNTVTICCSGVLMRYDIFIVFLF